MRWGGEKLSCLGGVVSPVDAGSAVSGVVGRAARVAADGRPGRARGGVGGRGWARLRAGLSAGGLMGPILGRRCVLV